MKKVSVSFVFTLVTVFSMAYLPFTAATPIWGQSIVDLVASSTAASTGLSFQRKSFYDAVNNFHYVFYADFWPVGGGIMSYASTPGPAPAGPWTTFNLGGAGWPALAGSVLSNHGRQFSIWYDSAANKVNYVRVEPVWPGSLVGPRLIYNTGWPGAGGVIVWQVAGEVPIPAPPVASLILPAAMVPVKAPFATNFLWIRYKDPTIAIDNLGAIWVSVTATMGYNGANGLFQNPNLPLLIPSAAGLNPQWTHYALDVSNAGWWTTVVPNFATPGQVSAIYAKPGAAAPWGIFGTGATAAVGPYVVPGGLISVFPVAAYGAFSAVAVLDPADPNVGVTGPDIVHIAYLNTLNAICHITAGVAIGPEEIVIAVGPGTWPTITADTATAPDTLYIRWAIVGPTVNDIAGTFGGWGLPQVLFVPAANLMNLWGPISLTSFYYSWGVFEGTAVSSKTTLPHQVEYAAS